MKPAIKELLYRGYMTMNQDHEMTPRKENTSEAWSYIQSNIDKYRTLQQLGRLFKEPT
jgi:hypothetical protein